MSLRDKLRDGTPVTLDPATPAQSRYIEASWIQEAIDANVPVILEHAIIRDPLNLRYKSIDKEFRLNHCLFEAAADLSYANFKAVVDFSGSSFEQPPCFQSASFEFDLLLNNVVFLAGNVCCSRLTIRQQLLATGIVFRPGTAAQFSNCNCAGTAVLTRADFGGRSDFSDLHVGGDAQFSGSHFRQAASFENASVAGDLLFGVNAAEALTGARFDAEANFNSLHVGQKANFRGAEFHGNASFIWAEVKGPASFGTDEQGLNAAHFAAAADFRESHLCRDADFEGISIAGDMRFSSAHCDGTLTFKSAKFVGAAAFDGLCIGEELNFEGALFLSKTASVDFEKASVKSSLFFSQSKFEGGVSFEGMKVDGAAVLFNETQFAQPASWANASLNGACEFLGARFLGGSRPLFDGAHFGSACSFDGAVFDDMLRCRAVEFEREASFQGTTFREGANFFASHFSDIARFDSKPGEAGRTALSAAQFGGVASFDQVRFERDARFDDVLFQRLVSFRETSVRVLHFSLSGRVGEQPQFQGPLDLTGCTYDRMRADWKSVLCALRTFESLPDASYNRQPYAQLEKMYRAVGQDRDADNVYLARRYVEADRLRFRREPFAWSMDRFYRLLANYGVRPHRLIVYALVGMLLGALAFHSPGSVDVKQGSAANQGSEGCPLTPEHSLGGLDAVRLSVRCFLPVDISLLPNCVATNNFYGKLRFQDWAALLHLLGWLLVPVGIASLSGILRRVAP